MHQKTYFFFVQNSPWKPLCVWIYWEKRESSLWQILSFLDVHTLLTDWFYYYKIQKEYLTVIYSKTKLSSAIICESLRKYFCLSTQSKPHRTKAQFSSFLMTELTFIHAIIFFILIPVIHSLKDVRVKVPSAVRKSDTVVLHCYYDLEGDSLYSVKWYKG